MEVIIVLLIIGYYLYHRYEKNKRAITVDLVTANLYIFSNCVSKGLNFDEAIDWMIESRYKNSLVYSPDKSFEIINTLKTYYYMNKSKIGKKEWVLEIITRMYEIENEILPERTKAEHLMKIISSFHSQWKIFDIDKHIN